MRRTGTRAPSRPCRRAPAQPVGRHVHQVPNHTGPSGRLDRVLRWMTAGESHGPELVVTLDGLPAGIELTTDAVAAELARRRLGYGRGARM
jgi:chorismate synthase